MKTKYFFTLLTIIALLIGLFPTGEVSASHHAASDGWTNIGPGALDINNLVIDPITPTTLYAATMGSGVFKSTDSGANWSAVNTGLTNLNMYSLAIDPLTPSTLYAGTTNFFKSTNGGASWSVANTGLPVSECILAIAVDPKTPTTLYVGTISHNVYKSTDGGLNWSAASTGITNTSNVSALVINPLTPATLYVGKTGSGVFKSTNGGANWSAVNTGFMDGSDLYVRTLAIDPLRPSTLYAGSIGGVFKTTNSGANWNEVNTGITATHIFSLAVDPVVHTTVYAGTYDGGVFKSTNSGESWSTFNTGLTNNYVTALAITPQSATSAAIYAGTWGKSVFSASITRLDTFNKSGPANLTTGIALQPILSWETVGAAIRYDYCYDTVDDNVCNGTWISAGTNTSVVLSGLSHSTSYYWQARAVTAAETTYADYDIWWSFTTLPIADVALALNPAAQTVTTGQNFGMAIEVRAGSQPVDGAAAYLNFNPAYLQVVSVSVGNSLPMIIQNTFDNSTGEINFSSGTFSDFPQGTFTLATVTFKALIPVSATPITFASSAPRKADVTFGGNSILTATFNSAVEITNTASVMGSITLQGRPARPDPRWSVPLNISLTIPGNSLPTYTFAPTTDNNGQFNLAGIVPGTYEVRVKHTHSLQNRKIVTLTAGTKIIDFGTLLEGDANNNNMVDLLDFSILATTYGKYQGTPGYDSRADFNGDNGITLLDFSLLASNYGTSGTSLMAGQVVKQDSPRQTQEAVTLSVDPSAHQVRVGKTFTVTIQVQAGSAWVDGAQASLNFDPTRLQVKQVTGHTSSLPTVILNTYDNSAGTVDYAAGTFSNFPTGTITLVEIEFEAIAKTSSTDLSLHLELPRTSEVTFAGRSVLTHTVDAVVSITDLSKAFIPVLNR